MTWSAKELKAENFYFISLWYSDMCSCQGFLRCGRAQKNSRNFIINLKWYFHRLHRRRANVADTLRIKCISLKNKCTKIIMIITSNSSSSFSLKQQPQNIKMNAKSNKLSPLVRLYIKVWPKMGIFLIQFTIRAHWHEQKRETVAFELDVQKN